MEHWWNSNDRLLAHWYLDHGLIIGVARGHKPVVAPLHGPSGWSVVGWAKSAEDALLLVRRYFEGDLAVEAGEVGLMLTRTGWVAGGELKRPTRLGPAGQ